MTRCPRCHTQIGYEQSWCLSCGAAVRTRIAPVPRWRRPALALIVVIVAALLVLGFSFARLTAPDGEIPPTATTTNSQQTPTPQPGQ